MDTTSVDFAISKISESWTKVAPSIKDVGEKYIHYVVAKQIISAAECLLFAVIFTVIYIVLFNKVVKNWKRLNADFGGPAVFSVLGLVFGGLGLLTLYLCAGDSIVDATLAITNPEMFTVHSIIEQVKK